MGSSSSQEQSLATKGKQRQESNSFSLQLNKVELGDEAVKPSVGNDDLFSDIESEMSDSDIFSTSYFGVNAENMLGQTPIFKAIAGQNAVFEPAAIPAVCFTDPEVVSVGLFPEEAEAAGHELSVGKFPLPVNGRAMTLQADAGFVRAVARKDNGLVVGIQAVGKNISEFASAFSLTLEMGACLEDIASTIHAHPTQGEGIQEAAMLALGHGLHI